MMFNYWLSVDRTLCNQAEKFGLSVNSEPRWKKCQPQLALLGSAALLQSQVALHSDWANMYSRMAQKKWRWSLSCSVLLPVQLEGPNGFEMFWAMAIRQMSWAALYKAGMAQGDTEHGHMESNIWVTRSQTYESLENLHWSKFLPAQTCREFWFVLLESNYAKLGGTRARMPLDTWNCIHSAKT